MGEQKNHCINYNHNEAIHSRFKLAIIFFPLNSTNKNTKEKKTLHQFGATCLFLSVLLTDSQDGRWTEGQNNRPGQVTNMLTAGSRRNAVGFRPHTHRRIKHKVTDLFNQLNKWTSAVLPFLSPTHIPSPPLLPPSPNLLSPLLPSSLLLSSPPLSPVRIKRYNPGFSSH